MNGFVTAYSKNTGRKVRVPAHFLDHPVLGKDLRKTPSQRKREEPVASTPETPAAGDTKKES